eukprot:367853-Rhodomonas_salina.6
MPVPDTAYRVHGKMRSRIVRYVKYRTLREQALQAIALCGWYVLFQGPDGAANARGESKPPCGNARLRDASGSTPGTTNHRGPRQNLTLPPARAGGGTSASRFLSALALASSRSRVRPAGSASERPRAGSLSEAESPAWHLAVPDARDQYRVASSTHLPTARSGAAATRLPSKVLVSDISFTVSSFSNRTTRSASGSSTTFSVSEIQ